MGFLEDNMNTIILGDACHLIKEIPDCSIDLVVTDPPYLINYRTNYRKQKNHKFCMPIENDNNPKVIHEIIEQCYRVLKNDTAMYMFCSPDTIDYFKSCLELAGFKIKNIIVWVKNNWTAGDLENAYGKQYELCFYVNKGHRKINGKRITDVWDSKNIKGLKRVCGTEQLHQNQKPLELIKMCIEKSSEINDLVLDPFMGSGTTGVASKEMRRRFIGMEIDEYFYNISADRLNGITSTGQTSIFTDFANV